MRHPGHSDAQVQEPKSEGCRHPNRLPHLEGRLGAIDPLPAAGGLSVRVGQLQVYSGAGLYCHSRHGLHSS